MLVNNKNLRIKGLQVGSPISASTNFVDGFNDVTGRKGF